MFAVALAFIVSLSATAGVRVVNPALLKGPEAAAKARAVLAGNPHLAQALARMEARGHKPNLDAVEIVSGIAVKDPAPGAAATGTLVETGESYYGDDIELIFIPSYRTSSYWEGTIQARRYNSSGVLINEIIGNVTGVADAPYAAKDEVPYEETTYDYDRARDGCCREPIEYSPEKPRGRGLADKEIVRGNDGSGGRGMVANAWLGQWRSWAKCSAAWCGGAAAGCGAANLIDGEVGWLPCTAAGCVGGAIGCTYGTLWN